MHGDAFSRLLADDEPPPVRVLQPEASSPFFLTADHAGRAIPRHLGDLGLLESELHRHIAWDIGIAEVTERLSELLGASAVLQHYSRLVIDCNRRPEWVTSIPVISELTEIPGNSALTPTERQARRQEIFDPYHAAIGRLLDQRRDAGLATIVVAMHSFTPVFKRVARKVEVGVLFSRNDHDLRLPHIMLDLLRAEGDLQVGENEPYAITAASDYTVPVHGEGRGLPHLEIEIRQDLISDAVGQASWADRLARLLPLAERALAEAS